MFCHPLCWSAIRDRGVIGAAKTGRVHPYAANARGVSRPQRPRHRLGGRADALPVRQLEKLHSQTGSPTDVTTFREPGPFPSGQDSTTRTLTPDL
eukprot:1173911-Rhodomonas_salina.1